MVLDEERNILNPLLLVTGQLIILFMALINKCFTIIHSQRDNRYCYHKQDNEVMINHRILSIVILAGSLFAACDRSLDDPTVNNELVPIELSTATRSFVDEGNNFAFRLLQKVAEQEKGNFIISPFGVTMAFGLAMEAAEDGEAMDEVCKVLGFEDGSREEIRQYCTTMLERLPKMDKLSNVSIANMVLLNNRFGSVNPTFSNAVSGYHNALVKEMSFSDPVKVVDYVNGWAKQNTNGMVENAISKQDIGTMVSAVLSNALYFNGKWTSKFDRSDTKKEVFTLDDGDTKKMDMMKQETEFYFRQYYVNRPLPNGVSTSVEGGVVRMMYGNGAFAMDLYLPYDIEEGIYRLIDNLANYPEKHLSWNTPKTDLWLPKFELKERRIEMEDILKDMGMEKAMSEGWLSFFDDSSHSSLDKVFQSAAIKVDESGTEAAAVTEIITQDVAALGYTYNEADNTLTFHCDHPFLYTITETSTGAILFAGVFRGE